MLPLGLTIFTSFICTAALVAGNKCPKEYGFMCMAGNYGKRAEETGVPQTKSLSDLPDYSDPDLYTRLKAQRLSELVYALQQAPENDVTEKRRTNHLIPLMANYFRKRGSRIPSRIPSLSNGRVGELRAQLS